MATVTQVNITDPDITETAETGFAGAGWTTKKHVGLVLEGETHLVAEYNVTAANQKYLDGIGKSGNGVDVYYQQNLANASWQTYYTFVVTDTYYTSAGLTGYIQASNLKVYYTPPIGVTGLDPDPVSPEGDFLAHLHDIRFTYSELNIVAIDPVLTEVSVAKQTVSPGAINEIRMAANSTGNCTLSIRKLNAGKTDYTDSYNFFNSTWVAKASGLQSKTITFEEADLANGITENVLMPSTDESVSYSVVMASGTLNIASSIPDAINELNFETVQQVRATFGPGTKTNLTNVAGTITTAYGPEMAYTTKTYPFTFTYTKSGDNTMTVARQPLASDITGHNQKTSITGSVSQGSSTILTSDTEGIKAGMYVQDSNFEGGTRTNSRIPSGTLVNAVSADTNFTMKNAAGSAVAAQAAIAGEPGSEEKVLLTSDWEYEFNSMVATLTSSTIVTVTGNLVVKRYGRSAPDGNIKLQPNFITIS